MDKQSESKEDKNLTERGVHNPKVIDLIQAEGDSVVLSMIEFRPWNSDPQQLEQLQEKFNNYLDYILDGYFLQQYPQYKEISIIIRLECKEKPSSLEQNLLEAMQKFVASVPYELSFEWTVKNSCSS